MSHCVHRNTLGRQLHFLYIMLQTAFFQISLVHGIHYFLQNFSKRLKTNWDTKQNFFLTVDSLFILCIPVAKDSKKSYTTHDTVFRCNAAQDATSQTAYAAAIKSDLFHDSTQYSIAPFSARPSSTSSFVQCCAQLNQSYIRLYY